MPKRFLKPKKLIRVINTEEVERPNHFPWFIIGISIIQLVIYYAFDRPYMIKSFGYNPYRRHEVWRFLSMVLVHEDELHLWDNVVMQICLGVLLEKYHGWQRVGSIYLISVVGGSLFTSAVSFRIYMAGASSAVMGLFFTQAVDFFLNWKNLDKRFFRVFSVWAYIIHSVLLTTLIDRVTPENHHTDRFVHIGGGFTGLFSAGLLMKNVKLEEWQNKFQKLSAFVLASLVLILIGINVTTVNPTLPPPIDEDTDNTEPYYIQPNKLY